MWNAVVVDCHAWPDGPRKRRRIDSGSDTVVPAAVLHEHRITFDRPLATPTSGRVCLSMDTPERTVCVLTETETPLFAFAVDEQVACELERLARTVPGAFIRPEPRAARKLEAHVWLEASLTDMSLVVRMYHRLVQTAEAECFAYARQGVLPQLLLAAGEASGRIPEGVPTAGPSGRIPTSLFYDSARRLHDGGGTLVSEQPDGMYSTLLPFQRRTVSWMLERERHNGTLSLPPWWRRKDVFGTELVVSEALGAISTAQMLDMTRACAFPRGGILAEEMGLGKTVEVISLITLHRRPSNDIGCPGMDPFTGMPVLRSGATLIVCPVPIINQWISELRLHAPLLTCKVYHGAGKHKQETFLAEFAHVDIVLTTYNVMRSEIHFAMPPPERKLRHATGRLHERPKSLLTTLEWWRVCIDEAQMVEGSLSSITRVAFQIPRVCAWAISGTPVRRDLSDLYYLFYFMRFEPFIYDKAIWDRMVMEGPENRKLLEALFARVACRNTKHMVAHELKLPQQNRYVVRIEFTAIEQQNYLDLLRKMLIDMGVSRMNTELVVEGTRPLDLSLIPGVEERLPSVLERLRVWFLRLRQICCQPQTNLLKATVGGQSLRNLSEVMRAMMHETQQTLDLVRRQRYTLVLGRAWIYDHLKEHSEALRVLQEVAPEIYEIIQEESRRLADSKLSNTEDVFNVGGTSVATRHRLWMLIQHKLNFFTASIHFNLGHSEEEEHFYQAAQNDRRAILAESERSANEMMSELEKRAKAQKFAVIPEIKYPKFSGGLLTRRHLESLELLSESLNNQANTLDQWREKIIQLLLTQLVDQEWDPSGEEYAESLDAQGIAMFYQEALRHMISDRLMAVTGQISALAEHDMKRALFTSNEDESSVPEQSSKHKADQKVSVKSDGSSPAGDEEKPPQMDFEAIANSLHDKRLELKPPVERLGSVKSIMAELRRITRDGVREEEREIAMSELSRLQKVYEEQSKAIQELEKEVEFYTKVYNERIEYYRQLQDISNTLMEKVPEAEDDEAANKLLRIRLETDRAREVGSLSQIRQLESRLRYLYHLEQTESGRASCVCIICQDSFVRGLMTYCGHMYCSECFQLWFRRRHNCPSCKRPLSATDIHRITLSREEKQPTSSDTDSAHRKETQGTSLKPPDPLMSEIKKMRVKVSYGSKIDSLVAHLLYLKTCEEFPKSVVYSQWPGVTALLEHSFRSNGIESIRITRSSAKTQKDPVFLFKNRSRIEVLLLDGVSQSSGLTLVNATHVFLCEPLLNPAIESQVMSRVHRIGQSRETSVWSYIVSDTVEAKIHEISEAKRMHESQARQVMLGKDAMSITGEVVRTDDLINCLSGQRGSSH